MTDGCVGAQRVPRTSGRRTTLLLHQFDVIGLSGCHGGSPAVVWISGHILTHDAHTCNVLISTFFQLSKSINTKGAVHFARSRLCGCTWHARANALCALIETREKERKESERRGEHVCSVRSVVVAWTQQTCASKPRSAVTTTDTTYGCMCLMWHQHNTSDTRARRGTHTHVVITYRRWNAIKTHQMAINFKSTAIYRRFLHHHYSDVSCLHLRFVWDWLDTESFFIIYSRNRLEITCELHLLVNN